MQPIHNSVLVLYIFFWQTMEEVWCSQLIIAHRYYTAVFQEEVDWGWWFDPWFILFICCCVLEPDTESKLGMNVWVCEWVTTCYSQTAQGYIIIFQKLLFIQTEEGKMNLLTSNLILGWEKHCFSDDREPETEKQSYSTCLLPFFLPLKGCEKRLGSWIGTA